MRNPGAETDRRHPASVPQRPHVMRRIIGVIGHVDHGKTALVRALTGMETDRLPEERRRGMSIALGFAHLALPGAEFDLIDMPGHERFVRTMVAGATGIDAVMLVVAANEGAKPQTIEHIDIAGLLGVGRAIIVASKADLATPERTAAVLAEAEALARQAGLSVAARIAVSALNGEGVAALREALPAALADSAPQRDDGFAYLPIDRAFSSAGHGTVVTGTLRRGSLRVSDELELAPSGRPVRIRALQVHGQRVTAAQPGQRVAANLRDADLTQVRRGVALSTKGLLSPASWLTVMLRLPPGAPSLRTGARLSLLFGSEETGARLRLLDRDEALAGQTVAAQLHCPSPVAVPARERFILRRPSPPLTVAGGFVLDPTAARRRRNDPHALRSLQRMACATPQALVQRFVVEAGPRGATLDAVARLAGVAPSRAAAWLQAVPIVVAPGILVSQPAYDALADALLSGFAAHEAARPEGQTRAQIAAWLPQASPAALDAVLAGLLSRNVLAQAAGRIRLRRPEREQARDDDEACRALRLAELLRHGGLSPPDPGLAEPGPQAKRLLDRLVREGVVVRAHDKVQKRAVLFHREAIEDAQRRLAPLLARSPGLLVGEAGSALGISRKFSVPLLEYLDAIQFTRRIGDRRMLARIA